MLPGISGAAALQRAASQRRTAKKTKADSAVCPSVCPNIDDLARIAATWAKRPEPIRRAMLALIGYGRCLGAAVQHLKPLSGVQRPATIPMVSVGSN